MVKKYLVIPGYIPSLNDQDIHYIRADQLMRLYGVSPQECIVQHVHRPPIRRDDLIVLRPMHNGEYGAWDWGDRGVWSWNG